MQIIVFEDFRSTDANVTCPRLNSIKKLSHVKVISKLMEIREI